MLALALTAPGVFAATINTTGQFFYNPWNGGPADRIDGDRSHFFDNPSADSKGTPMSGCNIGWYIQGNGSGCNNQPGNIERFTGADYQGPGTGTNGLPWLGNTSTTNNLDFTFAAQGKGFTVQLMAEANIFEQNNSLGVYAMDGAGNITAALTLFAGTDLPGKTVSFTPGSNQWGLYFVTGAGTYYTERLRGAGTGLQHFAVFKDAADTSTGLGFQKLWIGAEWLGSPDYNDMIFTLSCVDCSSQVEQGPPRVVPEPDTLFTFGSGLGLVVIAMLLGRVRNKLILQSATLRRGSGTQSNVQEPPSDRMYADGGRGARVAAGLAQTPASVRNPVCQ